MPNYRNTKYDHGKTTERKDPYEDTYHIFLQPVEDRFSPTECDNFILSIYEALNSKLIISAYTTNPIAGNPVEIEQVSVDTEQLAGWLTGMVEFAENYERLAKSALLPPPIRSMGTDLDRKTRLEAKCNRIITLKKILAGMLDRCNKRIILCENLLNNAKTEMTNAKLSHAT